MIVCDRTRARFDRRGHIAGHKRLSIAGSLGAIDASRTASPPVCSDKKWLIYAVLIRRAAQHDEPRMDSNTSGNRDVPQTSSGRPTVGRAARRRAGPSSPLRAGQHGQSLLRGGRGCRRDGHCLRCPDRVEELDPRVVLRAAAAATCSPSSWRTARSTYVRTSTTSFSGTVNTEWACRHPRGATAFGCHDRGVDRGPPWLEPSFWTHWPKSDQANGLIPSRPPAKLE
jgi:hypothetical protein